MRWRTRSSAQRSPSAARRSADQAAGGEGGDVHARRGATRAKQLLDEVHSTLRQELAQLDGTVGFLVARLAACHRARRDAPRRVRREGDGGTLARKSSAARLSCSTCGTPRRNGGRSRSCAVTWRVRRRGRTTWAQFHETLSQIRYAAAEGSPCRGSGCACGRSSSRQCTRRTSSRWRRVMAAVLATAAARSAPQPPWRRRWWRRRVHGGRRRAAAQTGKLLAMIEEERALIAEQARLFTNGASARRRRRRPC